MDRAPQGVVMARICHVVGLDKSKLSEVGLNSTLGLITLISELELSSITHALVFRWGLMVRFLEGLDSGYLGLG